MATDACVDVMVEHMLDEEHFDALKFISLQGIINIINLPSDNALKYMDELLQVDNETFKHIPQAIFT